MKVIVTGSSGFIGTNLIQFFIENEIKVLGLDVVKPRDISHDEIFKFCDIRDSITLSLILNDFQPDYIIHLAARTDLNGNSLSDYNSNILGVENMCNASSTLRSLKKIFFTSSMLVCENGYTPSSYVDFCPSTVYGDSKAKGEIIVRQYADRLPNFVIARPTSIWGPWFRTPYRDFFDMVLSGRFVDIGPKLSNKTYGYVGNTVHQIVSLMLSEEDLRDSLIYLGDNVPIDIRQWAFDICRLSGRTFPVRVPFLIIHSLAYLGDILSFIKISFPMTNFRLRNMTTPNIIDCSFVASKNKFKEFNYEESLINTLRWIKSDKERK